MDEGTLSDDRLRTLFRRMDAGEISKEEAAHVMAEHQVNMARLRRVGAEVDAEVKDEYERAVARFKKTFRICMPILIVCGVVNMGVLVFEIMRAIWDR